MRSESAKAASMGQQNLQAGQSWSGIMVPTAELARVVFWGCDSSSSRLCSSSNPGPAQHLHLCSCLCSFCASNVQRGRLQSSCMPPAATTYELALAPGLQAMQSLDPSLLGPPGGPLMPSGPQTARQHSLTGSPSWPSHRFAMLQSAVTAEHRASVPGDSMLSLVSLSGMAHPFAFTAVL